MPRTLVTPEMRAKASAQRRVATKGETRLWHELRELKTEGLKFRRQSPIGPYVADFACFDPKIVVEVDGDHHETEIGRRHDMNRDAYLRDSGFLVLRYDAGDAIDTAWHVAQDVKRKAEAILRSPHVPSPHSRRRTAEATPPDSLREPPSPRGGGRGQRDALSAIAGEISATPTAGKPAEGTSTFHRPPLASTIRIARRAGGTSAAARMVPEESPIALSYGGTTHAVMMGSPADLEDFALGFSLTEGIVGSAGEIEAIDVEELGVGIDIQIRLKDQANRKFEARRRRLAGPVGCGLCGIESIDEAMRAIRDVGQSGLTFTGEDIVRSVRLLSKAQPLHAETGAMHAAGFYMPGTGIVAAREDVGRHNALDKLAGALARAGVSGTSGFVVVTSRVSVEMVQKTAAIGAPVIVAVSAPTALAIRSADEAGMTLVALVRGEDYDIFTHPERITDGARRHVA